MSSANVDHMKVAVPWSDRDKRATRQKLPPVKEKPVLDYTRLKQLCKIEGLQNVSTEKTTDLAHQRFMASYKKIFVPEKPKKGFPVHSVLLSKSKCSETSSESDTSGSLRSLASTSDVTVSASKATESEAQSEGLSHNISDYLPLLHRQRRSKTPATIQKERVRTLRKLLRKRTYQRSAAENDEIYKVVRHFTELSGQVDPAVLKELCVVTELEVWKEKDIMLFGNGGFHVILRGSVQPISEPHVILQGQYTELRNPTPPPDPDTDQLGVGDCFGTLVSVTDRAPNSRILAVVTSDAHCEFLKITCSDYTKVTQQIAQRSETEKVNLLQSCANYKLWSRQPIAKVASLITWATYPPNTVLVSEGFQAPFVAIIKSGECHVLRSVEVLKKMPDKTQEKRSKQVVMGRLGPCASFGEISVLLQEPMTCSIVTASTVELACIEPSQLAGLDQVTLHLLEQSSTRTYDHLSQSDIHEEYISQELKREWNVFKHTAVIDVINSRGIRPGFGKWTK